MRLNGRERKRVTVSRYGDHKREGERERVRERFKRRAGGN